VFFQALFYSSSRDIRDFSHGIHAQKKKNPLPRRYDPAMKNNHSAKKPEVCRMQHGLILSPVCRPAV
jgi:hypothetical protein